MRGHGTLVRYADDLLALCKTRREAENSLAALTAILAELGLQLKPAKTRIVHLREGGEGVDFLVSITAGCADEPLVTALAFLARWPSRQAMQHARDRVRELTARDRLRWPVDQVVGDLNRFLRAGRVTSATATRPSSSTTSSDTRNGVYSCGSQPAINSRGATAETHLPPGLTATDWSASTEPSLRPGLIDRGVREPNAGGEERR